MSGTDTATAGGDDAFGAEPMRNLGAEQQSPKG